MLSRDFMFRRALRAETVIQRDLISHGAPGPKTASYNFGESCLGTISGEIL